MISLAHSWSFAFPRVRPTSGGSHSTARRYVNNLLFRVAAGRENPARQLPATRKRVIDPGGHEINGILRDLKSLWRAELPGGYRAQIIGSLLHSCLFSGLARPGGRDKCRRFD